MASSFFMLDDVFSDLSSTAIAQGSKAYSDEILSKKIKGRQRTFFIDLKQSVNGKFVKISELSRGGKRSTIMFDAEDMGDFVMALQEIQSAL